LAFITDRFDATGREISCFFFCNEVEEAINYVTNVACDQEPVSQEEIEKFKKERFRYSY
jgi:hypothetical protein